MKGVYPCIGPTTVHYTLLTENRRTNSPQLVSEPCWCKRFINNPRVEEKKEELKRKGEIHETRVEDYTIIRGNLHYL